MKKTDCEDKKIRCRSLVIDGTKYRTTLHRKYENRSAWAKPDKTKVYSFIPGTVVKILVKKGQCVKKGETLFILEAMKMQNLIKSPVEGIVEAINMDEGAKVPKGKILVELGFGTEASDTAGRK